MVVAFTSNWSPDLKNAHRKQYAESDEVALQKSYACIIT